MPWLEVPQTYKDAAVFASRLRSDFDVEYIRIGALCIFQDSKQDWQQESSTMGTLHKSSFCNLALALEKVVNIILFEVATRSHFMILWSEVALKALSYS